MHIGAPIGGIFLSLALLFWPAPALLHLFTHCHFSQLPKGAKIQLWAHK